MKIALSGSSGFVGGQLATSLLGQGHQIVPLTRADFAGGVQLLTERLRGCQAVIHLAGEPINRRWTEDYKKRLFSSRVDTTRALVDAMALTRPEVFISTSAIGAFSPEGCYTEADPPNASDFLGRLSRDWEAAAFGAADLGVRTLIFRFGLVLGHRGGLMKQVLPPFLLGLGGPVGSGRQPFSWIHIDDLVAAYPLALDLDAMAGVYHLCAPQPVTNRIFSDTLGRVLRRPALLPVPSPLLRALFGEGAEVMTSGQCLTSARLEETGYRFQYPLLEPALRAVVRQARDDSTLFRWLSLGSRA